MSMTSESDDKLVATNGDDENSGGANLGNHGTLKKGPWTSAEDAILIEYVTKHGEGNWNAVQKHSGLARCGKSCRLRWANHLRPDLKKGAFTPEEERHIIELHAKMGNKWARMAAELPGRTDNEIKNFWNTRIKRRQRAGLPIYPPDISLQSLHNENNPDNDDQTSLPPLDGPHPADYLPVSSFIKIPSVEFKGLELNSHQYLYPPQPLMDIEPSSPFFDIPATSGSCHLLRPGLDQYSTHTKPFPTAFQQSKRPRGPEPLFPGLTTFTHVGSSWYQSFLFPQYENDSTLHNVELPSLQTQTGNGGSPCPEPSLPFFEPVDVLIQTPPDERGPASSSGLLEDVLYGSEALRGSGDGSATFFGRAPHGTSGLDIVEDSGHGLGGTHWEGYDEQLSPLGRSPSSVFSESGPITPNSLDEPRLLDNSLPVKDAASDLDPNRYEDKVEMTNPMIFSRPDYMLASSCLGPVKCPTTNEHSLMENAMGKLLGNDMNKDSGTRAWA